MRAAGVPLSYIKERGQWVSDCQGHPKKNYDISWPIVVAHDRNFHPEKNHDNEKPIIVTYPCPETIRR